MGPRIPRQQLPQTRNRFLGDPFPAAIKYDRSVRAARFLRVSVGDAPHAAGDPLP